MEYHNNFIINSGNPSALKAPGDMTLLILCECEHLHLGTNTSDFNCLTRQSKPTDHIMFL